MLAMKNSKRTCRVEAVAAARGRAYRRRGFAYVLFLGAALALTTDAIVYRANPEQAVNP